MGPVAELLLDRPPDNRMDAAFFDALAEICLLHLPGLDAAGLVVRGVGRHFSSGADLGELRGRAGQPGLAAELERNSRAFAALEALPYPVVAAIGGACLGSGLELALACRRRVAAENAVLALPEAEHGLLPGCGGTVRLARRLGAAPAARLIFGATRLGAEEARALGLVDEVVPRGALVARARALAGGED